MSNLLKLLINNVMAPSLVGAHSWLEYVKTKVESSKQHQQH